MRVAARCAACGGERFRRLYRVGEYPIVRCRRCGLIQAGRIPSPEELSAFYDAHYAAEQDEMVGGLSDSKRAQGKERLAALEPLAAGRRLLDVGCSFGFFLQAAREAGWTVQGIEMSTAGYRYATEVLGLPVVHGAIETAALPEGAFDVVTMWDVLEHTIEPATALGKVRELLADDGLLALVVPNAASPPARLGGSSWPWMIPPAHLYYFTPETLAGLLESAGFSVERVETLKGDSEHELMLAVRGVAIRLRLWGVVASALGTWVRPTDGPDERYRLGDKELRARLAKVLDGPSVERIHARWRATGRGPELLCIARRRVDPSAVAQDLDAEEP